MKIGRAWARLKNASFAASSGWRTLWTYEAASCVVLVICCCGFTWRCEVMKLAMGVGLHTADVRVRYIVSFSTVQENQLSRS